MAPALPGIKSAAGFSSPCYAARHSITIRAWNGQDQARFILMTVRPAQPIDPLFSSALNGYERRELAQLLANALEYRLSHISD